MTENITRDDATWIVGAPRSGTHVVASLCCTATDTNAFVPEFHVANSIIGAWVMGRASFETQRHFFPSIEEMDTFFREQISQLVGIASKSLGSPKQLILKHCSITGIIPFLLRYFPRWRFVVCLRDVRDVLASEARGYVKIHGYGPPDPVIEQLIAQYIAYYAPLLSESVQSSGQVCVIDYESIANSDIDKLERFIGSPISLDKLWSSEKFDIGEQYQNTLAHSPGWGQPLTSSRVGLYLETISEATADKALAAVAATVTQLRIMYR